MSRIDDLIQALCPDGVATTPLGSLLDYEQPGKYLVASTDYRDEYPTPVLTAGQTFVLGHTNETEGIYPASRERPVLIFDDFTTTFRWVDFPFKAKSSAMKMLTLKPNAPALIRYVYFAMQCIGYDPRDHARHWIGKYSLFRISVPPLEVQREIVGVLDKFTQLEAELEAELEARRYQYEHYRREALTFGPDVQTSLLGDLAKNLDSRRKPVTRGARVPGAIPYYGASGIVDYVSDHIFDGDYLLVSEDGANLLARTTPIAFSISGKTWVNNHAHVLEFSTYVERRFVEVYLNSIDLAPFISGAAQPKLNKANLNKVPIPDPPMAVKEHVVEVLDKFDALLNGISVGLPAELAARRRQYEHYRDRLLSFEELVV
ncbi:restriction endonuclease subunit S [Brachybacterium vulturis]|uniref:restriction endonuclease subunit S n=1 Tax=Brachybacterium vulturis TaxID=2017484 RepID=UPI0037363FD9